MSHTLNLWELAAVTVLQLRIIFFPDRINTICHFISFWMWKWNYDYFLFSSRCRRYCFIFWQCVIRHHYMKFKASSLSAPLLIPQFWHCFLDHCYRSHPSALLLIGCITSHSKCAIPEKEDPKRMTKKHVGICEVVNIHTVKIWYWLWQYISELQV